MAVPTLSAQKLKTECRVRFEYLDISKSLWRSIQRRWRTRKNVLSLGRFFRRPLTERKPTERGPRRLRGRGRGIAIFFCRRGHGRPTRSDTCTSRDFRRFSSRREFASATPHRRCFRFVSRRQRARRRRRFSSVAVTLYYYPARGPPTSSSPRDIRRSSGFFCKLLLLLLLWLSSLLLLLSPVFLFVLLFFLSPVGVKLSGREKNEIITITILTERFVTHFIPGGTRLTHERKGAL